MSLARTVVAPVGWSIGLPCGLASALLGLGELSGGIDVGGGAWQLPIAFLVFAVVHELGHVGAARAFGAVVDPVRARGLRLVMVHQSVGVGRDILCVLAGPGAACAAAVVWAGAAAAAGSALVAGALAFGLGHLASLGLPSGDGRALRALLRERAAPPVSTR